MLFKSHLVELLILLLVTISFAWIGVEKNKVVPYNGDIVEGMENEVDVPQCSGSQDPPSCYDTINSEYDPYAYDTNYILKTRILPPLCPACPSTINNHHDANNLYDGLLDEYGNSITNSSTEINQTSQVSNSSNEEYNSVTNIENTTINNLDENRNSNSNDNNKKVNDKEMDQNKILSDKILERQKQFFDREKESENTSSQCPPCPACERCPEPAFTCEKVINYKSPSSKQYLPMPVLNDFSNFPSSS